MPLGEFDVIARYFARPNSRTDVLLGIGDDAAVLDTPRDRKLVIALDTIVEDVHFLRGTHAADVGYRSLAVNLSDLAAMGAEPAWFTLSLSMPHSDEAWLQQFAAGLFELAQQHDLALVGGDTVKGPLVISVQIAGWVETDRWLTRSGARPGDAIFVSGTPGDAAAGLAQLQRSAVDCAHPLAQRFLRPTPRIALGRALRSFATACMDVSDGLLTDLDKLCAASHTGARIDVDSLPLSDAMRADFSVEQRLDFALAGGDDYELLFTVSETDTPRVAQLPTSCTRIGVVTSEQGVLCEREGKAYAPSRRGYDHFT